ncbi:MAG: DUF4330 family protein [Eubacteriales bacterium]
MERKNARSGYRIVDALALIALIVVLLVLLYTVFLLIFGGFERFTKIGKEDGENVTLTYVLCVEGMDENLYGIQTSDGNTSCSFLSVGDALYYDGKEIGTITAIDSEDCLLPTEFTDENGNLVYLTDPGKVNLLITVESSAQKTDTGYRIDELDLYIGDEFLCSTKNFEKTALIRVIEQLEDTEGQVQSTAE